MKAPEKKEKGIVQPPDKVGLGFPSYKGSNLLHGGKVDEMMILKVRMFYLSLNPNRMVISTILTTCDMPDPFLSTLRIRPCLIFLF